MIFNKMKRDCFLRLFSIVLAVHTIQDGLIVNAASASHKGMTQCTLSRYFSQCNLNCSNNIHTYTTNRHRQAQNNREKKGRRKLYIVYWVERMYILHEQLYKSPHFNTLFHWGFCGNIRQVKRTSARV